MPQLHQYLTAKHRRRNFLAACLTLGLLTACQPGDSQAPRTDKDQHDPVAAGMTGINHTTTFVASFYVDGAWGGNISEVRPDGSGGGGGKSTCCVMIPYHYRPGLTAKVRWNHTETRIENWKETVAIVEPYQDGQSHAWVNFLPGDQVRIVITDAAPWHPNYKEPYKAPSHPEYQGAEKEFNLPGVKTP